MKQLLLYFMYFVASSAILLQCAKMFPSPSKMAGHKSSTNKNQSSAENTFRKETPNIAPYGENGLKSHNISPVVDNSSIPGVIIGMWPNDIYNPFNFRNYKLALNEKWQRN